MECVTPVPQIHKPTPVPTLTVPHFNQLPNHIEAETLALATSMLAPFLKFLVLASFSFPAQCELTLPGALVPLTSPKGEEMLYRSKWKEDAILLLENFVAQARDVAGVFHLAHAGRLPS